MIIKTSEKIQYDPDIWLRATYYVVELDAALRANGGEAEGNGVHLTATPVGFHYHETLPNSNVFIDISVGNEGIEGFVHNPNLYEPGAIVSDEELEKYRLKGETIIAKLIKCAPIVEMEFIDTYPQAS